MGRHIDNALARMPNLSAIAQRLDIICPSSNGHGQKPPESRPNCAQAQN